MADYRNCTCIACRNEFEPDDDIVVCPECGTPYHRDCWNDHGHCINTELHERGEAWTRPESPKEAEKSGDDTDLVRCPNCGSKNDGSNLICSQCGSSMHPRNDGAAPFGRFTRKDDSSEWRHNGSGIAEESFSINPEEDMDGARMQDVADFVGKNQMYYLPRFRYFRDQKRKLAPNFVCILFPELYFAYRKMWLLTILTIVVIFLLSIPSLLLSVMYQTDTILAMLQDQMGGLAGTEVYAAIEGQYTALAEMLETHYDTLYWMDSICSYLTLVIRILAFLFGNYLYYRHTLKKIRMVRENQKSLMDVQPRIRIAGGAHFGFVVLAFVGKFILTAVFTYWIMFI